MLITKEKLYDLRVGINELEFFILHYKPMKIEEYLKDVIKYRQQIAAKYKEDAYLWCYWLIAKSISRKATVKFALFAALQVDFERDDKLKQSLMTAKAYLDHPSRKARETAWRYVAEEGSLDPTVVSVDSAVKTAAKAGGYYTAYQAAMNAVHANPKAKNAILEFGIKLIQEEEQKC